VVHPTNFALFQYTFLFDAYLTDGAGWPFLHIIYIKPNDNSLINKRLESLKENNNGEDLIVNKDIIDGRNVIKYETNVFIEEEGDVFEGEMKEVYYVINDPDMSLLIQTAERTDTPDNDTLEIKKVIKSLEFNNR